MNNRKRSKSKSKHGHRPHTTKLGSSRSAHHSKIRSNNNKNNDNNVTSVETIDDDDPEINNTDGEYTEKETDRRKNVPLSGASLRSGVFDLQQFEGLPHQIISESVENISNSKASRIDLDSEFVNERRSKEPSTVTSTMNLSPRPPRPHGILKKHGQHGQPSFYSSTQSLQQEKFYPSPMRLQVEENYHPAQIRIPSLPTSTHVSPSRSLNRVEQTLDDDESLSKSVVKMERDILRASTVVDIDDEYYAGMDPPFRHAKQSNGINHRNSNEAKNMDNPNEDMRFFQRHTNYKSNHNAKNNKVAIHHISHKGRNKIFDKTYEEEEEDPEDVDEDENSKKARIKTAMIAKRKKKEQDRSCDIFITLTFAEICQGIFFGDAPLIREFLNYKQDSWKWRPIILFESFFRSISALSLASNVFGGVMIYVTMVTVNPFTTVCATIGLCSGMLTSLLILQLPIEVIRSGAVTYNGYLVGIGIGELASGVDWREKWDIFLVVIIIGAFVIFVSGGLSGIFVNQLQIPPLNFTFNLVCLLYIKTGLASMYKPTSLATTASEDLLGVNSVNKSMDNFTPMTDTHFILNSNNNYSVAIEWTRVIEGIILAPSHFYGTKTLWSSCLVYTNYFIFSRIFFCQAVLGAAIGLGIGLFLEDPVILQQTQYQAIYDGAYAYNSLLTSITIGGMFFVFNLKSWLLSVVASTFTALMYAALTKNGILTLGYPFMVGSWLFLSPTYGKNDINKNLEKDAERTIVPTTCSTWRSWMTLYRVANTGITTPENHVKEFLNLMHRNPRTKKKIKPKTPEFPLQLHL